MTNNSLGNHLVDEDELDPRFPVPVQSGPRDLDQLVDTLNPKRMGDAEASAVEKQAVLEASRANAENSASSHDERPPVQDPESTIVAADPNVIPDWVVLPPDLKIPRGKQLYFLRFRADWTEKPEKGERQCILWNLSDSDENMALKRAMGDGNRAFKELTKQMIRAVDGKRADWSQGFHSNIEKFWREVGSKARQAIVSVYHKTHTFDEVQSADFFTNCWAVRTAAGG